MRERVESYLFNILFEAFVEHFISFVKIESLQILEVDVASSDVVSDSPSGPDKNFAPLSELLSLNF